MMYRLLAMIACFGGVLSLSLGMGCVEKHLECPQNYELTENNLCRPPLDHGSLEDDPSGPGTANPDTLPEALPVPPYVSEDGLNQHIMALMAIASESDNTRAIGTAGYEGSVTYVANYLQEAGYEVTFQEFPYETYEYLGDPELDQVGAESPLLYETDFIMLSYSGTGEATGVVQGVDVQIPPPQERNTSTSGCEEEDFENFVSGQIALIQRGSCTFAAKATNAEAAGAIAVLIFNEGQEDRQGLFSGTLDPDNPVSIPVYGMTYAVGEQLLAQTEEEVEVHLNSNIQKEVLAIHNVIVDYPGISDKVWMMGAHLDSVPDGPGINDNGTGVASLLEIAKELAAEQPALPHGVRFAFWGAEEAGLVGSLHYVRELPDNERDKIFGYLNFDMVGSPNPGRFVYDGDGSTYSPDIDVPAGSEVIEEVLNSHFETYNIGHGPTQIDGRSDYEAFALVGIPVGGLFTGANERMNGRDAGLFGGRAGAPYDACYHQFCDKTENVNLTALYEMANAAAYGLFGLMESPHFPSTQNGMTARSRSIPVYRKDIPTIIPGNCHHALLVF